MNKLSPRQAVGLSLLWVVGGSRHVSQLCDDAVANARGTVAKARRERGSVSIEHVLWAVAVIAIVGIVVVAITNYVTSKSESIK